MSLIDENRKFISVNFVVLTISDSRTIKNDRSGDLLVKKISETGHKIFNRQIIKDEVSLIKKTILSWSSNDLVNVIITTGGTGLTKRDSTPEAIREIADKIIEGFGELFRLISYKKIGTSTVQSRALGAIINGTYIFALPGSTSACKDAWDDILQYQLDVRHRPCNFIEIMSRLNEK